MANKIYIAWDGDGIGRAVGRAVLSDSPDEVRRISQAIEAGNGILKAFMLQFGSTVSLGGDEGSAEVGPAALPGLEAIRQTYATAVGATLSIGIGKSLSEASKALLWAKLHGKNQIALFRPEMAVELAARPEPTEADKIRDEYLDPVAKAIADIAPGKPTKTDGKFNYSHVLPDQFKDTHKLHIKETPFPGGGGHSIEASIHTGGKRIGFLKASSVSGVPSLEGIGIHESYVAPEHRGGGLGTALYEAVLAHGFHVHGNRIVRGDSPHSSGASAVHRKLAAKHGLDYSPVPGPGRGHPEYDQKFGPYKYTLKEEFPMLKGEFGDDPEPPKDHDIQAATAGQTKLNDADAEPHTDIRVAHDADLEKPAGPPPARKHADFEARFRQHADAQEKIQATARVQNSDAVSSLKIQVADALGQIKQELPALTQLKETQPAAFQAVLALVRGVIALGQQLGGDDQPASEPEQFGKDEPDLGKSTRSMQNASRTHLPPSASKLPPGSVIDGKMKVRHAEGGTGYVGVLDGMVAGQDREPPLRGANTHPVSSKRPETD